MTILVTGASGFVGLNVIKALLTQAEKVIGCSIHQLPSEAAHCISYPVTIFDL